MPEENTGLDPNTAESNNGQEPEQGQQQQADAQLVDFNAVDADGKRLYFDAESMRRVREEAAQYRTLYQDVKKALEARSEQQEDKPSKKAPKEKEEPTPEDEWAQKLKELEARERTLRLENAILAEAARHVDDRAPFVDPRDALALVDKSKIEIQDDGTVKGVEEALNALAEAKPHLLVAEKRRSGVKPTNPGQGGSAESQIVQLLRARQQGQAFDTFGGGGVQFKQE